MGRVLSAKNVTLAGAAAVLIVAGLLPLGVMGAKSLGHYGPVLSNARNWKLLANSLLLAGSTTAVAALAGVPLAILFGKTNLPFRRLFAVLFSLPLLLPPYVLAVGWFQVLGSSWLFGLPGCILVLASCYMPVVMLLTMVYLRTVNPALEEAGRLSANGWRVLTGISLPLAAPGVILSLLLVFLLTLGEFGATTFLRFDVFPVASFTQFSAFYDFGAATAAAMPLVAITLAGLLVERRFLHGKTFAFRWAAPAESSRIRLRALGPLLLLAVLAAMAVALPLSAIFWRGASPRALGDAFHRAGDSALCSLLYAVTAATILTPLGFLLSYLIHRRALPGWRLLDALGLFLFTLPGTVLGIGLIVLWNHPATNWIYGTPLILVAGFIAQYTALSTRLMLAGLSQVPVSMEEAAELSGAGWFRGIWRILAPLCRGSIGAAWIVTCLFCLRDSSLPLLL
ncbi:MAG: iron ABC transporter permease, partial [Planctomycetes bacterium]|nr:iron ABC transporter permease [Planctomycetota bacterium]